MINTTQKRRNLVHKGTLTLNSGKASTHLDRKKEENRSTKTKKKIKDFKKLMDLY